MNLETARRLNAAAAMLALHLKAIPGATEADVALVRAASLAQLQTAKDVVEARNAAVDAGPSGIKVIWCVCADPLLERVKCWADRQEPV